MHIFVMKRKLSSNEPQSSSKPHESSLQQQKLNLVYKTYH